MTRKLTDIETKELSFVDKAANKKQFLFFKQDKQDKPASKKLKKKINIVIDSDGTVGGTKIAVNKDAIKNLRDFNFSFWGDGDASRLVSCSYSKFVEAEDGFSRSETFYLSKGDSTMNPKVKELLQKYFGEDEEVDFEKAAEDDVLTKSLETVTEYQAEFPDDLKKAVGVIAKQAGMYAPPTASSDNKSAEEDATVEKAGAKFSKETLKKLQNLVIAIKALEDVLPKEKEGTEKADADGEGELKKCLTELTKSVEQLEKKNDEGVKGELAKSIKELASRIATVEKGTGVKKSEDGQDDETGDDGTKKKWPTISGS